MKIKVFSILFCLVLIFSCFGFSKNVVSAQSQEIVEIQTRLRDWGYYDGELTGELDGETIEAVKYLQREHGLRETGEIDGATANALGVYISGQVSNDLYLLAKCIYAEARGEVYEGMVAVGAVILNRVESADFPNTVYSVIYQPWAFTAVHDGQINLEPNSESYQAAQDALNGWDPSYGSLYYYNPAVATSSWIFNRQTVTVIGKHVFAI